MADTTVLNAEPARPEDRKEEGLPPKSFADAVQQGKTVNDTVDAKSRDTSRNQNETNGTGVGLKEEATKRDEPIRTDNITNGKVNDEKQENVQKMELGGKSEASTPKINGFKEKVNGAVRNRPQSSLLDRC